MSWTTKDEMKCLKHMTTTDDAEYKLSSWIKTSRKRRWDRGIDVEKCLAYADMLLFKINRR